MGKYRNKSLACFSKTLIKAAADKEADFFSLANSIQLQECGTLTIHSLEPELGPVFYHLYSYGVYFLHHGFSSSSKIYLAHTKYQLKIYSNRSDLYLGQAGRLFDSLGVSSYTVVIVCTKSSLGI